MTQAQIPAHAGGTVYFYSLFSVDKLEKHLAELGIVINIKPVRPPPGLLVIPDFEYDLVVVDLEYCGTEERTARLCVERLREGGFKGPIIVNDDGNEHSSLLQIAGASHRVSVAHEEKQGIGLALAKTIRDVVKDIVRYRELKREPLPSSRLRQSASAAAN